VGTNNERVLREKHKTVGFVVCVRNEGYETPLELRKIYQAIPDAGAARHHLLRVVDESGEDYLYPQDFFLPIELPKALEKAVLAVP
jgi:primosomal protein N'